MAVSTETKKGTLCWQSELTFEGTNSTKRQLTLDGNARQGFSPMDALLSSAGACMGIDIVVILKKMKTELETLEILIEGEREEMPPCYFHSIKMQFQMTGNIQQEQAERAVQLSFDKYCSVFHTLRKDIKVDIETIVE